jgi:uncharacterized protein (DUF697 family)
MPSILKLPDLWRVIREMDLESIRRDAEGRFRILVLAPARTEADAAAILLTGDETPHPWIEAATPDDLDPAGSDLVTLTAALIVGGAADLTPGLALAADRLRKAHVPIVTVVHGSARAVDGVVRPKNPMVAVVQPPTPMVAVVQPPSSMVAAARSGEAARTVVAALDAPGLEKIAHALVGAVAPSARLALARQLPPLRAAAFDLLIDETAKANATYAFTAAMAEAVPVLDVPLNVADILILTKNQLLMGYKIALGAGKSGRARDVIGEIIGVVGGGFLFRQAARQLIGLIPVAGLIPKVAIAYTGTWAIGRAVVVWATQGRRLSPSALGRFSRDAAGRGRDFARELVFARRERRRLAAGGGPAKAR